MSKLARALTLVAMIAAMQLAGMTTVAQPHPIDQASSQAHATVRRLLAREGSSIPDAARPRLLLDEDRSSLLNLPDAAPAQAAADAAHQRLLDQERYYSTWNYTTTPAPAPPEPSGQPGWRTPALGVLAVVLALVAGVAMLAARRTHRAEQTA